MFTKGLRCLGPTVRLKIPSQVKLVQIGVTLVFLAHANTHSTFQSGYYLIPSSKRTHTYTCTSTNSADTAAPAVMQQCKQGRDSFTRPLDTWSFQITGRDNPAALKPTGNNNSKSTTNYQTLTFLPLKTWYHTDVPPKSMWKSVKQPFTLIRQYLQRERKRESTRVICNICINREAR